MMALQNDPQLRGAYQELQAVGYGVMAARAGLLPSVTGEANRSRVKQNVINSQNAVYQTGQANWNENGWALTLTQPILDLGAFHKWRQSQEAERKEVASYAYAQQDLMLRTATAYLSILAAQDQIELTEAERNTTQKQMELVRARYRSGQETEVGVSEVQARLDLQAANTLLARHDYLDKQQGLQEIIGYGNVRLHRVRRTCPWPCHSPTTCRSGCAPRWSRTGRSARPRPPWPWPRRKYRCSAPATTEHGAARLDRPQRDRRQPVRRRQHRRRHPRHAEPERAHLPERLHLRHEPCRRQPAGRGLVRTQPGAPQGAAPGVFLVPEHRHRHGPHQGAEQLGAVVRAGAQAKEEGFKAGLNDVVSVLDATRNLYNAKRQQAEAGYNFVLDGLKLKQAAGTLNAADIAAISQQIL